MTITKQHTIAEVLRMNRQLAHILRGFGMHCLSCPFSSGETLEQACAAHGADADELVSLLNAELENEPRVHEQ